MRNLKRALSLALASVMLLGMMVVGAGAVGYPDVDSNDNAEAIEVLQAVKVMVGDDNGNFNPDDQVNRAQMAVVMALLLDLNYDYYQGADPGFWDVPSWAAPYVAACYANGIVSGYGDGQYGSADPVTAVQAASMMMRALGYFQYPGDYQGNFELSTVSQASKIRLFDGIDATSKDALTRNEVARLALNTLKTPIVEPDDNTISFTDPNGNIVATGGQVNYVVTASSQPFARAIGKDEVVGTGLNQVQGYVIELGEQLYNGKLELRDNNRDDFGRPARTWVYNGTEIGSYAKKELLVPNGSYTDEVTGKAVYELLGQSAIRENDLYTFLDGADNVKITKNQLVRSYDTALNGTGRGVLTEIYLDTDRDELSIVSINTWLARAATDYNANSESITLNVYDGGNGVSISKRVEVEDAPFIMNMKKDDWCLVQWADESDAHSQKAIVDAFDVEIREDQDVTSFKRGREDSSNINDNSNKYVSEIITGGETIKNNAQAWYKYNTLNDFNASALVNKTYTVFMDQYDNFIGIDLYSGKDQYVFITGYDRNGSNISVNTAKASGIFTDGTMQAIDVDVKATNDNITAWHSRNPGHATEYVKWTTNRPGSVDGNNLENMWYQYTENRGVYTLTPVDGYTKDVNGIAPAAERNVNSSKVYLSNNQYTGSFGTGNSYGEDASIYITVDNGDVDTNIGGDSITEVNGVYTGAQDVNLVIPSGKWIHAVWKDSYIVAAIVWGEAEGTVENYAYIRDGIGREWKETDSNGNVTHFWEFDAVMNGETVTKTIKSRFSNTVNYLKPGQVQELIIDNDGYVTSIKNVSYPGNLPMDDKLYNNQDFQNFVVNGVDSLKGNNVYHVETNTNAARQNNVLMPTLDSNGHTPLAFQGNTLRYDASNNDLALPVARDAKAVVSQKINGSTKWTNYDSVSAAYSVLNDADRDPNTNKNGAKQFDGEVIAVLDGNGVAAWVVFIDYTPTDTTNPDYGMNSWTNGNITVKSSDVNPRTVLATIENRNLTITVPVYERVAITGDDLLVSVTVDGQYYGYAAFDPASSNSYRLVFRMDGMGLNNNQKIVIVVTEKDNIVPPTSHSVIVNAGSNGTATVSPASATAGTTVRVTATPNEGYVVDTMTTNVNGTNVTVNGNVGTFTMPDEAVTVTVTFKEDDGNTGDKEVVSVEIVKIFGHYIEITTYSDGTQSSRDLGTTLPGAMVSMGRAAIVPEPELTNGTLVSCQIGDFVFTALYTDAGFVNIKMTLAEGVTGTPSLGEPGETAPDGSPVYVAAEGSEKEIPAVTGTPSFTEGKDGKANVVDLDLGEPMIGGKLPTEILIDDTLTAEITWEGDTNSNGIADEGETLTYTYTVVKAAEGKTVTGSTEITVGETTYSVPEDTMNSKEGVSVDDNGVTGDNVTDKDSSIVTLTLGGKLVKNAAAPSTNEGAKVFAGTKGGTLIEVLPKVVSTSTGAVVTYDIKKGQAVEIQAAEDGVINNSFKGTYMVGETAVTVTAGTSPAKDTITFVMDADMEVNVTTDDTAPTSWKKVIVVDVRDGITGTWKKGEGAETALKAGENYVEDGSSVTLTSNGTGTVVLQDDTMEQISAQPSALEARDGSKVFDAKENAKKTISNIATDTVLRSGIKVTLMSDSAKILAGADEAATEEEGAFYVALGETLSFQVAADEGDDSSEIAEVQQNDEQDDEGSVEYTGFLVGTKVGTAAARNQWTVSGSEDVEVYGAYRVLLSDVTATAGDNSDTATTTVTSGQYVAAGQWLKAAADKAAGTSVVEASEGRYVYKEDALYTNAAIAKNVDLTAATRVDFHTGEINKWGLSADACDLALSQDITASRDKKFYVKNGTYLKAVGTVFSAYEGTTLLGTSDVNGLIFKVGTKNVEVKMTEQTAQDAAAELVKNVRAALKQESKADKGVITVMGNEITAKGNLYYVGAKPFSNGSYAKFSDTAAGEMNTFLKQMHTTGTANEITYKGVIYTWGNYSGGGENYVNADGDSIIKVVVDDTKDKLTTNGATVSVEIGVKGMTIKFNIIVDETLTSNLADQANNQDSGKGSGSN